MNEVSEVCPLCLMTAKQERQEGGTSYRVNCSRCGDFRIHVTLLTCLPEDQRIPLSGIAKESSELRHELPVITNENLGDLLASVPQRIPDKGLRLLGAISRRTKHFGQRVTLKKDEDRSLAYTREFDEFAELIDYLEASGLITHEGWSPDLVIRVKLSARGFETLEARDAGGLNSDSAFVAMSFDDSVSDAFLHGIKPAIEDDCGFRSVRIDLEEHNDDIIDRVLAEIRKARFVVADFTNHRNGVYFEAGYALGLSTPVIWLCRGDHRENAHFDTEHFNHIFWTEPQELRRRLALRIQATIGVGPRSRNT